MRKLKIQRKCTGRELLFLAPTKDLLRSVIYGKAQALYGLKLPEETSRRIKYELNILEERDCTPEILYLSGLVDQAREKGLFVGQVRGTAPSSIVLYLLGLTAVDPVAYGLLSERFINRRGPDTLIIDVEVSPEGYEEFVSRNMQHTEMDQDIPEGYNVLFHHNHVKAGFLSQSTLSNLRAVEQGEGIDLYALDLDDQGVYDFLSDGNTDGVYPCEAERCRELLRAVQPRNFSELIAFTVLIYPFLEDLVPKYVGRKQKLEPISYTIEAMEEVLEETYGLILYQEQVMLLGQKIAGFSPCESDELRKVVNKARLTSDLKQKFITGGVANGYDTKTMETVWQEIFLGGRYAFCKAHAVSTALTIYLTAYIKLHFS